MIAKVCFLSLPLARVYCVGNGGICAALCFGIEKPELVIELSFLLEDGYNALDAFMQQTRMFLMSLVPSSVEYSD